MGFSLKSWASHALKVPKGVRKINIGKQLRKAVVGAVENFEERIKTTGTTAGGTVSDLDRAARATALMPWLLGGIAVVALLFYMRKR